jgi:hypothetical protein
VWLVATRAIFLHFRSDNSHSIRMCDPDCQCPSLQANFYQDASSMGEMSPFLLFDGDDDAKMDKRGPHSGKTDVAKKVCCCGAGVKDHSH